MKAHRLLVTTLATCALVAAHQSVATPPPAAKPAVAPAPAAPRPAAPPAAGATPVARGPAQPTGVAHPAVPATAGANPVARGPVQPTGVVRPQGVPGTPAVASGAVRPGAVPPARARPGEVAAGQPAGAPGAVTPAAGLKERPPYKVGVDGRENYPSNRGFATSTTEQLKPGQIIDRYGSGKGTFAAPGGTPVGQRALPPGSATKEYGMYQVQKPITTTAGPAKPAFDQPGKGKQYDLPKSVDQHVKGGDLKRYPPDPTPADEKKKKEKAQKTEPPPPSN